MQERIVGYDLARALAVFGMVVVNFKIVMGAASGEPAWLASVAGLVDGRAAATFVVLAGVGISLWTRQVRISGKPRAMADARRRLLKRSLFLFIVGSLYTSIWPADILHFYGLYIAVGALLLSASTRSLWTLSVAITLAFVVLFLTLDYEQGWNWDTLEYAGLWTPSGAARHLLYNGFHPVIPWLAFLLLGMVLGRRDMRDPAVRRRVFLWGAGAALAAESASWLLIGRLSSTVRLEERELIEAVFGTEPMPPLPLYMLAGAGTACAVIAASIAFGERYADAAWLRPFVATGQLALTLYVAHVIVGMGTLEALGRLEHQSLPFSLAVAGAFCAASVGFAHVWRRRFRRGPLEAILRAVTNPRQAQPGLPT